MLPQILLILPLTYVARRSCQDLSSILCILNICILLSKSCCIIIAFSCKYVAGLQGHSFFDRLRHHASTRLPNCDTGAATRMRVKLFAVTPVQTRQESPLRDVYSMTSFLVTSSLNSKTEAPSALESLLLTAKQGSNSPILCRLKPRVLSLVAGQRILNYQYRTLM